MTTRRSFLQSVAAFSGVLAGDWSNLHPKMEANSGPDDPLLRSLAMRALNAATDRGAKYADIRFSADRVQNVSFSEQERGGNAKEEGSVYVGVRALVDGYWGFAAGCNADGDVIERLAHEAVDQAKVNNWGAGASVVLDSELPSATGSWTTPVERDPFTVSIEEKVDFLSGIVAMPEVIGLSNISVNCDLVFRRQQKVFASTTGAYLTQTLIWTGPSSISVSRSDRGAWSKKRVTLPLVPLQSAGYEATAALRIRDQLPEYVDILSRQDETTHLDVGRYDVVFDAQTIATLARASFGHAIELDRINGDEINSVGTSYLSPKMIGTKLYSPLISITGTRTLERGPSRTAWDDDGIKAQSFDVVRNGVLTKLATGREHAATQGSDDVISNGCSVADHAANLPLVRAPDLVLEPSSDSATFDSMVSSVKNGVAVMYGRIGMDRSLSTGQGMGTMFEIRNGKLGRCLDSVAYRFRTTDFWKNVSATGGASSAELHSESSTKGEPTQDYSAGTVAVPILATDVTMFDPRTF